ncbi:unnamed protein product, partial [Nesidiocoris tenuis]
MVAVQYRWSLCYNETFQNPNITLFWLSTMKNSHDEQTADGAAEHDAPDTVSSISAASQNKSKIVLESFFYELTGQIDNFKTLVNLNLKVFTVIGQPVTSLDGIEQLKHLTELWVCECPLTDASAVIGCAELKKLYLYSNRLTSAPKTTGLRKLCKLSLACNAIKELELCFAESLKDLNLADNAVSDIQNLAMCRQVEILNLSGNNLSTFGSLEPLQKLPKLRTLNLCDPMYRKCPVTSLANYRSYTIHTVSQLNFLDGHTVEFEERENVKRFMGKNFRFYKVLSSNYTVACYAEHDKQLESSYNELDCLQSAMVNTMVNLSKSAENSKIEKECRKKQRKYEVVQFRWERKHWSWLPRLRAFLDIKRSFLELEMLHFGNINFVHHTEEGSSSVKHRITTILQNFICPYTKKNAKLSAVDVSKVIQIINIQHHNFDHFKGVKDVMGIGISESQSFIISQPGKVCSARHWQLGFIQDYVELEKPNMKCLVTNSFAIADQEWLSQNAVRQQPYADGDLEPVRVLVLGYVISDELMGSFTRQATAEMHLKTKEEPSEHCHHCAVYSSSISVNVVPVFIVEYCYVFKDNSDPGIDDEYSIQDEEACPFKPALASSKFNTITWLNLTSLNLSKTMLSSFGSLASFEGIEDLDISYNQISCLQEVSKIFPKLSQLRASHNQIKAVNFGKEMNTLTNLDLAYNKIKKFNLSVQWLKKYCKSLEKLSLAYNPITDVHSLSHIRYLAIQNIRKLTTLDGDWLHDIKGEPIVYTFAAKDFKYSSTVTSIEQEKIQSRPKLRNCGEFCVDQKDGGSSTPSHFACNELGELICLHFDEWKEFERLEVSVKTTSVKWLTIRNNLLAGFNFVKDFPALDELDLSHNMIHQISVTALSTTRHLVSLNLAWNYLKDLDSFSNVPLQCLRVLNISYNFVKKLDGLKNLIHLEEMYAAGNEIKKCEPLQIIQEWTQLRIIDLSGNPFEDAATCRKLLIYHGPHLEYVNGVAVTREEVEDANDALSCTLNKQYLSKLYKPSQIKSLSELTMKKCGIRRVNLREIDLQNLTSVNLENNALTSIGALGHLKKLKRLCLSKNKITHFGDAKRSFDHLEMLHLDFNYIADLQPLELERFPRLTALFLQDNCLTTVEGVKELRRLQYLVLDRNKISTIKPNDLSIESLKELYLEFNLVKDTAFLK